MSKHQLISLYAEAHPNRPLWLDYLYCNWEGSEGKEQSIMQSAVAMETTKSAVFESQTISAGDTGPKLPVQYMDTDLAYKYG